MGSSWQLPSPRLRASIAQSGLMGTVFLALVTTALPTVLEVGAGYGLKATTLFVAAMIVAGGHASGRHPYHQFGPANQVTTGRLVLVCLVAALIGEGASVSPALAWMAAAAALAVAVSDGVDGWLARRTGMSSEFGARFDMETDALLIMALSILVWEWNKAGVWIVLAGAMRYLFVGAAYVWPWIGVRLEENLRRKVICVVLIVGLTSILLPFVQPPRSAWLALALLLTLAYSFAADLIWLWRRD